MAIHLLKQMIIDCVMVVVVVVVVTQVIMQNARVISSNSNSFLCANNKHDYDYTLTRKKEMKIETRLVVIVAMQK